VVIWVGAHGLRCRPDLPATLAKEGYRLAAVVDGVDGGDTAVEGIPVEPLTELEAVVEREKGQLAVLACADDQAAEILGRLIRAGIRGILNLTGAHLPAPAGVHIRHVNLSTDLFVLSYRCLCKG